jgi:nucleoside-diphosphate-sugar epimerase
MRVLIIGGTGLISTGITRQLVERGEDGMLYNRGQREAEIPVDIPRVLGDRKQYTAFEAQMAGAGPFDAVIDMVALRPEDVESAIRAFDGRVLLAEGARRVIAWQEGHGGFHESDQASFYDMILDAWKRLGASMAQELAIGGEL